VVGGPERDGAGKGPGDSDGRSGAPAFVVRGPLLGQGAAAESILRALPQWFGIESAIVDYASAADESPTFGAVGRAASGAPTAPSGVQASDKGSLAGVARVTGPGSDSAEVVGFVTVKPTSEDALELHVMGVLQAWHRRGVGGALVACAAAYAVAEGFALLHVKTLAPSDPDPGYAATRAFYLSQGFLPLEVLPAVWGPENPCLLLVKPL
jgi:ribosomal protein S18 acetylase RimI-like enzyme